MASTTDPAKELADFCVRLRGLPRDPAGIDVLAVEFGVDAWSAEFYELIFAISKRISDLDKTISSIPSIDQSIKDQATGHLGKIRNAFSQAGLNSSWSHSIGNFISPENVSPILFLSSEIRRVYPLPSLSTDEMIELLQDVDDLLDWLRGFQIKEQDFIRQAIIEGLEHFRFRAERVSWVGWGYTLDSLRAVIGAYLALERGIDPAQAPDGEAVLKKLGALLRSTFEKVGVVKDATEKANWLIEGYKNISALALTHQGIAGLLTFAGGG